jgi:hypothetical protein
MVSPSIPRCRAAYGADLGRQRLVLVRAERGGTVTTLWNGAAAAAPLQAASAEVAAAGAAGRALLAAALPATDAFARWIETPLVAADKAQKVLPALLDVQLPFPLETCLYAFSQLRPGPAKNFRALACAARRSDIEARLAQLGALGLDPALLTHEGLVLWRQAQAEIPLAPATLRVVAYLGDGRTTLAVGSGAGGGELISLHGIRLGADELAPPDAPAVRQWASRVNQLLRALPAGAEGEAVQWLWCGPGAELAAPLEAALAQGDRVHFKSLAEPALFLARALALAALAGAADGQLRSGDLTHPALLAHIATGHRRAALNLLLAGGALLALALGWQVWLQRTNDSLQAELLARAQELSGKANIQYGTEIATVQAALKQRAAELQPFTAALAPVVARDLAAILAAARKDHVTVEALSYSGTSLIIRGATDDWNRCDPLAAELRLLGFSIELSREEAGADELVRFTLKGTRR